MIRSFDIDLFFNLRFSGELLAIEELDAAKGQVQMDRPDISKSRIFPDGSIARSRNCLDIVRRQESSQQPMEAAIQGRRPNHGPPNLVTGLGMLSRLPGRVVIVPMSIGHKSS